MEPGLTSNSQLASLQTTVGIAMLQRAQNVDTAGAIVMLQELQKNMGQTPQAPHPFLGNQLDVRL